MITLGDIEAARDRIAGQVRTTPMLDASLAKYPVAAAGALWLKLELLQIGGSFKARGASHKVAALDEDAVARGLVTASGGNHGIGVAYAGWRAGVPVRVYLPRSTPQAKIAALADWGAVPVTHGEVWDEANAAAMAAADDEGLTYVHPFADVHVVAGQGTLALEIVEALPDVTLVVAAIGGGGMISGLAIVLKALRPDVRLVGVEPVGAPTLRDSVRAGHPITLDAIETSVGVLAPRQSAALNVDIIARLVDDIVLVSDEEMHSAARWLWREFGIGAELAGAAAVAALREGRIPSRTDEVICAVVCGAGTDGMVDSGDKAG
jgi:threonine dehydratase